MVLAAVDGAPAPATSPRAQRAISLIGLALGLLVPVGWYLLIRDASYSYDEATYVELSRHPWRSSYYPDEVFARHPPLAFLALAAWRLFAGEAEAAMRGAGVVATLIAVFLVFRSVRARWGPAWGGAAAALVGSSLLAPLYGAQATLYPFAFLAAAIALDGWARGNARVERVGLALFALTHLFGFVFLAARIWRRRAAWRREIPMAAAPVVWLVSAAAAVIVAANRAGPGLGPWWQPTRAFEFFYQVVVGEATPLLHVAAFIILILLLNPVLLRGAWHAARRGESASIALLVLAVFLFTGPAFLRFGLPLLPAAYVAAPQTPKGRALVAFLVAATLGTVGGAAYIGSGIDPRAQNDVPGFVDWGSAMEVALERNASLVAGPAPTSLAYYAERLGFHIASSAEGPDNLTLRRDGSELWVWMGRSPATFDAAIRSGAVLVVPDADAASQTHLRERGIERCGTVHGAALFCS